MGRSPGLDYAARRSTSGIGLLLGGRRNARKASRLSCIEVILSRDCVAQSALYPHTDRSQNLLASSSRWIIAKGEPNEVEAHNIARLCVQVLLPEGQPPAPRLFPLGETRMAYRFHTALLALGFAIIAFAAQAAPSHSAVVSSTVDTPASIEAEAKQLLSSCAFTRTADDKRMCRFNQEQFIESYLCAFAGDYTGQRNVAEALSVSNASPTSGVQPVDLLACAWGSIVVLDNPLGNSTDVAEEDRYCGMMDQSARHAAGVKAAVIAARIRAVEALNDPAKYCPWYPRK